MKPAPEIRVGIQVHLTHSEQAEAQKYADRMGVTLGDWCSFTLRQTLRAMKAQPPMLTDLPPSRAINYHRPEDAA
jgi:hypothetical protein